MGLGSWYFAHLEGLRRQQNGKEDQREGQLGFAELEMDDLAILKGGGRRLCQLALARLCLDERITVEESRWETRNW